MVKESSVASKPRQAQYVRLAHDSSPVRITRILTKFWKIDRPSFIISIIGGASADLRKATFTAPHVQASSAVTTVLPGSLDRSVAEVAGEFEMPLNAEMLLHCDAVMTIEENSVTETEPHNAKMYARPAHNTL